MSIIMLASGIMMLIAALQGRGNDTKTLPNIMIALGLLLAIWSTYRTIKQKNRLDYLRTRAPDIYKRELKIFWLQIPETILYLIVMGVGIFLLLHEHFTDKALNLMAGGFTILNSIFGVIKIYKTFSTKDFQWKLTCVLTIFELVLGLIFIIKADSISINEYILMGILTTTAGVIEVISSATKENLQATVSDGKKALKIIKESKS